MKKFLYRGGTKLTAFALCIAFISAGMLTAVNGFIKFCGEKDYIYGFENSFEESDFISSMLGGIENIMDNTSMDFYYERADATAESPEKTYDECMEERLKYPLYEPDELKYYIAVNGRVYTNCNAKSADELKNARIYRYFENQNGKITREGVGAAQRRVGVIAPVMEFADGNVVTICTSISDEDAAEFEAEWNRQAALVRDVFINVFVCAVFALLFLIYLICVSGRNVNGKTNSMWIDLVWTEAHIAIIGVVGIGVAVLCAIAFDQYYTLHLPAYMLRILTTSSAAMGGAVMIASGLSLARKIRCKTFVKTSVICRIAKWCYKAFDKIIRGLYKRLKVCKNAAKTALSKKSTVFIASALLAYTAVIGICGILVWEDGLGLALGVLAFGAAVFALFRRCEDMDNIRKGAAEIRNGNLRYKIPDVKSDDMKTLAEDINEIGEGLEKTVADKMKAERLKTDLITNVSHDLKTPLTSIISYTALLSKVEELPEEAKDYISIIAQKSERLKNLTQDLFEVSKVQSGNETFVTEKLDAKLLINQTLGEHNSEIQKSELKFCVNTDTDLFFTADGRKMSRVIGNLIDNAMKYAMKGTRVFVSAFMRDDDVIIEIKNISAYPMDFDAEEITGRFVRGDAARTGEGHGLGLAIAKGYTEACGGKFDIIIDGDLFKTVIRFPKA